MNKKLLSIILVVVISISALSFSGCSNTTESSNTIRIGTASPMTGDYAQFGEYVKEGLELAKEEINSSGGVLGKQIEIVYADDKGDSKEAVSVAQKFVSDSSIVGILGHFFSGATLASGPIYQQNGMPTIAIASTNPDVAQIGDYVYRINVGDNYQGSQLAKYLYEVQKVRKVAVVYDNNDYGKGVSSVFIKTFKELGGDIVAEESYIGGQEKDFSVIVTKLKASNPEAVMMASYYTEGALIVQQSRNSGLAIPFVCTDSMYTNDFITLGGKTVEGVRVVAYFHPSDTRKEAQEFVKKYREKYGKEANSWSPFAYDALYTMADAIKRAGSLDKKAIQKAISETKDLNGATGATSFANSREPEGKDLVVLKIENGEYTVDTAK